MTRSRRDRNSHDRERKVCKLMARDGNLCWYCGIVFEEILNPPTVEHLGESLRTAGTRQIDGQVLACYLCNHIKGIFSVKLRNDREERTAGSRLVWSSDD